MPYRETKPGLRRCQPGGNTGSVYLVLLAIREPSMNPIPKGLKIQEQISSTLKRVESLLMRVRRDLCTVDATLTGLILQI